jgi:eukaryotic-like serine/threonine-protein kinase
MRPIFNSAEPCVIEFRVTFEWMAIQVGDIVGDYEITGVLGRGGMGRVFRVRSRLTDREEAMKVVLSDLDENPAFAERFLREIKVHASLQHPNIAALYSAQRIGDRLVMILELVEGVSLEAMLRSEGIAVPESAHYIIQVLEALAYAHERGVVHRDIKPANILIGAGGVVKLTDFGIARSATEARLTGTGQALGTLAYMSPEQIGAGQVDARSDLYSLGLTFYEMLTGRRAMQGSSEHALMSAQLGYLPPEPSAVNPRVPGGVSAAIMRAMAKDPAMRFQTARDFQAALRSLEETQVLTPAPAMPQATTIHTPELAELESRLSRAIGPIAKALVADAARRYATIAEIRQALASQIEDPKERETFIKTSSSLKTSPPAGATTSRTGNTAARPPDTAPASFDPAALERLTQALAPYIGPIAKVVVTRAARGARSMDEVRNAAAAEIDTQRERQRFLETTRGIS